MNIVCVVVGAHLSLNYVYHGVAEASDDARGALSPARRDAVCPRSSVRRPARGAAARLVAGGSADLMGGVAITLALMVLPRESSAKSSCVEEMKHRRV